MFRYSLLVFFVLALVQFNKPLLAKEACLSCHQEEQRFSPFHDPEILGCTACHGGNPKTQQKKAAHQVMQAYPGELENAQASCGQSACHQEIIPIVKNSIMNSLQGMIEKTRLSFDEDPHPNLDKSSHLQDLGRTGADSYLRKLCVSCHLGKKRKHHYQSLRDRGGGCNACHLKTHRNKKNIFVKNGIVRGIHPTLTIKVEDKRCFGCHSRSSRISLNYLGLAEVDQVDPKRIQYFGRLPDKRLVEQKTADVHSKAGMACIDCHTVTGIMGGEKAASNKEEQLDIQCTDCHLNHDRTKSIQNLSQRENTYLSLYKNILEGDLANQVFVTEKKGTPLFHLFQKGKSRYLRTKIKAKKLKIPAFDSITQHQGKQHQRLSCDSCHSAWAPQCYGCHIEYDSSQQQWDHLEQKKTAGRWIESRWAIKNELPGLGITKANKITPFIPGMIFTLKNASPKKTIKKRLFASTSPHTTQKKSRSCESCHQHPLTLGLIKEWQQDPKNRWTTPIGWIEKSGEKGQSTQAGARSFNQPEISRILKVGTCLKCHQKEDPIYSEYQSALNKTPQNLAHSPIQ